MKKTIITLLLIAGVSLAEAQKPFKPGTEHEGALTVQPFLFSVNTLTAESPKWNLNYSGSYGERVAGAFGFDGVSQDFSVKGYLGNRFTLYANAGFGMATGGKVSSQQQAELMRDFIGGKQPFGPRLGLSMGFSRDMSNVAAVYSRVTGSFEMASWRLCGNLRFEKAFSSLRDDIDLITSIGFQHRLAGRLFGGIEAIGEDLEGFWDAEEAEGGAKLLLGPSLNMAPANSRFAFSVCGGPVFYATRSSVIPSEAIRDVGSAVARNGYTVRAMVTFNLHQ